PRADEVRALSRFPSCPPTECLVGARRLALRHSERAQWVVRVRHPGDRVSVPAREMTLENLPRALAAEESHERVAVCCEAVLPAVRRPAPRHASVQGTAVSWR